jgi:Fe2+ or Zn2+ uptake regulation protein
VLLGCGSIGLLNRKGLEDGVSMEEKVRTVVCEKCREETFELYRKERDPFNYFLVCMSCGKTKEFRAFAIWDVETSVAPIHGQNVVFKPTVSETKE